MALREQANASRYLLPVKEVVQILDRAAAHFRNNGPAEAPFELAIVDYIRAVVLVQLDETTEEALRCTRRAISVFHDYADEKRELNATLIEAGSLYYLGQREEAITIFRRTISDAQRLGEKLTQAYALKNIGVAYVELNLLDEAELVNAEAEALFEELHVDVEKLYVAWNLAFIAARRGDLARGAAALDLQRHELLKVGLKNDFALATLDWAEVRLQMQKPQGVAKACRDIIMQFEAEGMQQKAAVALDYVNRALAQGDAKPALIRQVRDYLGRLPRRPDLAFVPAT